MQGRAHRHGRLIGLRLRATGRRQRRRRGRAGRLQALQHSRDALVAGGHLGLVDLIQLQRLGQGEDVLLPVVADQRRAQGRERGLAAPVAQGGQAVRIALAGDNGPDDAQPRLAGDVSHHVLELQVHLDQRLLHVLDVGGGGFQEALALAQIRAQGGDLALRVEAGPQKPVLMQTLQPLGVAHVRLAARHLLDLTGIDHHHREAALGEDLVERDPVDPGRLQGHGGDPALLKPVGEALQVAREGAEGTHRFGIAAGRDGRHMHPGADVNGGRVGVDWGEIPPQAGRRLARHGRLLLGDINGGRGCARSSHS